MNNYRVLKPFKNIDGAFLRVNDAICCTPERASLLYKNGMIGGIVENAMVDYPIRKQDLEKAIDQKPKQKRKRRKSE